MTTIVDKILSGKVTEIFHIYYHVEYSESGRYEIETINYVYDEREAKKIQKEFFDGYTIEDMEEQITVFINSADIDKDYIQELVNDGQIDDDEDLQYYLNKDELSFELRFDELYKEYDFKSLEGALILEWYWDRYVGYAQKYRDIRIGTDEDESITIPQDYTFKSQYSVVMSKDEIESCDTYRELYYNIERVLDEILDKCNNYPDIDDMIDEIYRWSFMYSKLPEREKENNED